MFFFFVFYCLFLFIVYINQRNTTMAFLATNTPVQGWYYALLEDTARYPGQLLAPSEGFGLQPRLLLPFGQKKMLTLLLLLILVLVTFVTLGSNPNTHIYFLILKTM